MNPESTSEMAGAAGAGSAAPPRAERHHWLALYTLCAGMLMIVLDVTVTNVALPTIQDDLGFSQSSLAWVVNGYLITFGGLLLLAGRLGDLLGHRRVFLAGLAIFTGASLLCGFSQTQEMLVGARFIQGIGGAMASAVILGMIVTMFQHPSEQAKAIGVYGFVASAGGTIGLLLGGVLTEAISWHWIFFINVPIGIATAIMSRRLIEDGKGIGFDKGADIPGAALLVTSLMIGVYTIVKPAAELGWTDPQTLILGAVSGALLVGFIFREGRLATPLVPLRIFRSRNVSGANVVQALLVAGMFSLFFMGALYMQEVLGYDALDVGFAFLPTTLVMGTMSLKFAEPLMMRFGPRNVLIVCMVIVAVGLGWFSRVPVDGDYWVNLLGPLLVLGLGIGGCFPSLMTLAMSGASMEDAGLASGHRQHVGAGRRRDRPRRSGDPVRDEDGRPEGGRRATQGLARGWLRARLRGRRGAGRHRRGGRRARAREARRGGGGSCGRRRHARGDGWRTGRRVRRPRRSRGSRGPRDARAGLLAGALSGAGTRLSVSRKRFSG